MSDHYGEFGGCAMRKKKRPQLNIFLDAAVFTEVVNAAAGELQNQSKFGRLLFMYAWGEYKRCGSLKELYARPVKVRPLRRA